jgi:hypothetical protein
LKTKEERYARQLNHGTLHQQPCIVCPHCFAEDHDPSAYCLDDDGDTEDYVECESCGKLMDITVHVEKTYTTTKVEEEEDPSGG